MTSSPSTPSASTSTRPVKRRQGARRDARTCRDHLRDRPERDRKESTILLRGLHAGRLAEQRRGAPYIDATTTGHWGLTGGAFAGTTCDINGSRCTFEQLMTYLDDGGDARRSSPSRSARAVTTSGRAPSTACVSTTPCSTSRSAGLRHRAVGAARTRDDAFERDLADVVRSRVSVSRDRAVLERRAARAVAVLGREHQRTSGSSKSACSASTRSSRSGKATCRARCVSQVVVGAVGGRPLSVDHHEVVGRASRRASATRSPPRPSGAAGTSSTGRRSPADRRSGPPGAQTRSWLLRQPVVPSTVRAEHQRDDDGDRGDDRRHADAPSSKPKSTATSAPPTVTATRPMA